MIGALSKISSCSKLEIIKNFVNQNEILHYDIFNAIVCFVNKEFYGNLDNNHY